MALDGNGGNGIRITNREVYDALLRVRDDVQDLKQLVPDLTKLDRRVTRLEFKWYAAFAGLVALCGGMLSVLIRIF